MSWPNLEAVRTPLPAPSKWSFAKPKRGFAWNLEKSQVWKNLMNLYCCWNIGLVFLSDAWNKIPTKESSKVYNWGSLSNIIFTFQNNDPNYGKCGGISQTNIYSFSMSVVQYMGLNVTKSCTWDTSNSIGNLRHSYILIISYYTKPCHLTRVSPVIFVVPPKRSHQTPFVAVPVT